MGRGLPATLTFDYPTVNAIADYLAKEVIPKDSIAAVAGQKPEVRTDFVQLATTSRDRVKSMLDKELRLVDDLLREHEDE